MCFIEMMRPKGWGMYATILRIFTSRDEEKEGGSGSQHSRLGYIRNHKSSLPVLPRDIITLLQLDPI